MNIFAALLLMWSINVIQQWRRSFNTNKQLWTNHTHHQCNGATHWTETVGFSAFCVHEIRCKKSRQDYVTFISLILAN